MPKAEGAAVLGTLRTGARARTIATDGPIVLTINGRLAERVRELARDSGASSVESYCEMMLEWFVVEHRSGKERVDPLRHTSRHDDEWEAQ
jgi:hypothetical protein